MQQECAAEERVCVWAYWLLVLFFCLCASLFVCSRLPSHPIIFSTVQLLDPGLAGIMSAMFGIEGWPVGSTYLGVALVTAGIFLVVLYQTRRETEAELQKKEEKQRMENDSDDENEAEQQTIEEVHEHAKASDVSSVRPRRSSIRGISISDEDGGDDSADFDAAALELSSAGAPSTAAGAGRGRSIKAGGYSRVVEMQSMSPSQHEA